jgi:hypothetical protein
MEKTATSHLKDAPSSNDGKANILEASAKDTAMHLSMLTNAVQRGNQETCHSAQRKCFSKCEE